MVSTKVRYGKKRQARTSKKINHHKSTKNPRQISLVTLQMSKTLCQWKTGSYLVRKPFSEYLEKKIYVCHMQRYSEKPSPVNMYQISNKPKRKKFRFTATEKQREHTIKRVYYTHTFTCYTMVVVEIDV